MKNEVQKSQRKTNRQKGNPKAKHHPDNHNNGVKNGQRFDLPDGWFVQTKGKRADIGSGAVVFSNIDGFLEVYEDHSWLFISHGENGVMLASFPNDNIVKIQMNLTDLVNGEIDVN